MIEVNNCYSIVLENRIEEYGIGSLTPSEIIAILLETDIDKIQKMFIETGANIKTLQNHISELNISEKQKRRLQALYEFAKKASGYVEKKCSFQSPSTAAQYLMESMRCLNQEHFVILCLDARLQLIKKHTVTIGTVSASIVHPREVFGEAMKLRSSNIILAHNHPTGCIQPSSEDEIATKRLIDAGNLLGIIITDHIIIGDGDYYSFKENNEKLWNA